MFELSPPDGSGTIPVSVGRAEPSVFVEAMTTVLVDVPPLTPVVAIVVAETIFPSSSRYSITSAPVVTGGGGGGGGGEVSTTGGAVTVIGSAVTTTVDGPRSPVVVGTA